MTDLRVQFPKPCGERWEEMSPRGCNRHCASCDKVIHDLSLMTYDEVDALIADDPDPCVRAQIGRNGVVQLKKTRFSAKLAMAAAGTTAALATTGCQSFATPYPAYGNISGKVENGCWDGVVTAVAIDGRRYQGIVNQSSRKFVVRYVPHGNYDLRYSDRIDMKGSEPVGRVIVSSDTVSVGEIETANGCVITGLITITPDHRG